MERERTNAVADFSADMAVDASAGTGKTAALIARVTNLFLARPDLSPDHALLLTFTEKAAAEMKSRLIGTWERLLAAARAEDEGGGTHKEAQRIVEELPGGKGLLRLPGGFLTVAALRARLEEMVEGAGRLFATTFHSFCAAVLRSFPAEAGIDPRFEILAGPDSRAAWDAAFGRFMRREFGEAFADPRWAPALANGAGVGAAFRMIRRLCLSHRDLLGDGGLDFGSPADFLGHLRAEYAEAAAWFEAFARMIARPDHEMAPAVLGAREVLRRAWDAVGAEDLPKAAALAPEGIAAFSFDANRLRSRKAFPLPPGELTPATARDALRAFFESLRDVPRGDEAARFLVDRARAALAYYDEAKGNGLDFMDLLLRARALLLGNPAVAARLSARFRCIFVDEFQDTDPLQAEVLRILSAAGPKGRLFIVGDPKQSIYSFRRADIQEYHRFRREILSCGGKRVTLGRNFRSRPELVETINGLFSVVLRGGRDFAPAYVPVAAARSDRGEGPAATLFSLRGGQDEPAFLAALAARIAGAVPVGGEGDGPARPASWRDIAVLFRSDAGGGFLSALASAFDAAGVPYVVPARKGFYLRREVQDLRIVLAAIDAPADLSLRYAALKTIFFGLGDDEIIPYYLEGEGAAPPRLADALAVLRRLSKRRGRVFLSDLVAELYDATGVEFVAALANGGDRIAANLAKAAGLARAFERKNGPSLKGFVAELARRADEDREEGEFPFFDEGEDAVRISTIHGAKGLEFPVVILCGLSRGGGRGPEGLCVDRGLGLAAVIFPGFRTYSAFKRIGPQGGSVSFEEWERAKIEAEERRILYVAATRARDRLFLVEGEGGRRSELVDALRGAVAEAADGGKGRCPVTGLLGRRRLFAAGGELLEVEVTEPLSDRRGEKPSLPVPEPPAVLPRPEGRARAGVPAKEIFAAEIFNRERARRFGEKVHRLLEAAPPVGPAWSPATPSTAPVWWGEGERRRWEAIVRAIANSPFRKALRGAALVGTELPLLRCRGGRAEEERADLVVEVGDESGPASPAARARQGDAVKEGVGKAAPPEGSGGRVQEPAWGAARPAAGAGRGVEYWVVDYKTGGREKETEEIFARQVQGYVEILKEAWGRPVRGFVWYVETGDAVEVTRSA